MNLYVFTMIHTLLSFVALGAGAVVAGGLLQGRVAPLWTGVFLLSAFATSATGFGFPFAGVLPSHVVGVIALAILVAVVLAQVVGHLQGRARTVYAAGMVASLYLLAFVAVAQAFAKIGPLRALAPTQSEAPFAVAQGLVLIGFVWLGIAAARGFSRRAL